MKKVLPLIIKAVRIIGVVAKILSGKKVNSGCKTQANEQTPTN
jgi:hypothetical protein